MADVIDRRTITRNWTSEPTKTVEKYSILLSVRAPVGEIARASEEVCLGRGMSGILPHKGVSREFLAHALTFHTSTWDAIQQGSTFTAVNKTDISKFEVVIPNNEYEQKAIAEALSDIDELIENLKTEYSKSKLIKEAFFNEYFGIQSISNWELKSLSDVGLIFPGINKSLSFMGKGTYYVTVQDLYSGSIIDIDKLGRIQLTAEELKLHKLETGDIVFGKSSVKRDGIGYPNRFIEGTEAAVASGFTFVVRPKPLQIIPDFLFYSLRSKVVRNWVINNSQASALTNLNASIANKIPIFVPKDINTQKNIANYLNEIESNLVKLENEIRKYEWLKQGMMNDLLTGKVRLV
jgi:type I restriction enzyme S subunit